MQLILDSSLRLSQVDALNQEWQPTNCSMSIMNWGWTYNVKVTDEESKSDQCRDRAQLKRLMELLASTRR